MERHVKERLIGAAVLMAAAIILIPEMLSGPERHESEPARRVSDETNIKTYTIDLNRPPGTPQEAIVAEESPAPPPETEQPLAAAEPPAADAPIPSTTNETNPESDVDTTAPETERAPSPEPQSPAKSAESPRATTQPTAAPRAVASESSVPTSRAPTSRNWAVQLGSFSSRSSADRLASQFRADGYDVFVMPVETRKSTLYRVRIGPMRDRAAADETLRRVRAKVAGAAVVAHP